MQDALSKSIPLSVLADRLDARLVGGDSACAITGVNTIQDAGSSEMCFLTDAKYRASLAKANAAAVLVGQALSDCAPRQLVVGDVNKALVLAQRLFAPTLKGFSGIDPTAVIDPTARIDPTAVVGPRATIGPDVAIGPQTVIGPGCVIGEATTVGSGCRLDANVVVYHHCRIGNDCIIQANTTLGSTGFGYVFFDGQHQLIPHNGGVILEDGVEIGANTCIDRAKFGNTVIGAGTKIDNLVQIAHNVRLGKACLLAGMAGVGGSAVLGDGVVLAGGAGVVDHITLGSGAIVGVQSMASKDVAPGQKVLGFPARSFRDEMKSMTVYQQLPELAKEVKTLAKKIEALETAKDDKN